MKYLLPLCLIATLFFISCNDDDATPAVVTLPPITSEGLNTFGCLVNGEVWVAEVNNNIDDKLDAVHNPFLEEFHIDAKNITSLKDEYLLLYILNFDGEGEYSLTYLDEVLFDFKNSRAYELDTTKVRLLNIIKFSISEKIISGEFEFTCFRGEDTLKITEGRFDTKFRN